MSTKKLLAFVLLPLFLAAFLQAQSVAELSKKEKERRAAIKGKPAHVVTNADLAKVKKRPAVEVVVPEKAGGAEQQAQAEGAEAGQEGVTPPAGEQQQAAGAEQKPAGEAPAEGPAVSEKEFRTQLAELKVKSDQAQEQVDLYTLKMNGLWQEFYSLDDMKSRELIQLQISETYDKLTKAQLDADKAKKELDDFMANARREGVPSIWIR
jgi:hypothetical protein